MFTVLVLFSGILLLSGCASLNQGVYLDEKAVKVERIDSPHAKIGFVSIKEMDTITWIRGNVSRHTPMRGRVAGHLDVTVTTPDGKTIYDDTVSYKRKSAKARKAQFFLEIKSPLEKGTLVQIKHHYYGSHH